jgi:hypothetical protein
MAGDHIGYKIISCLKLYGFKMADHHTGYKIISCLEIVRVQNGGRPPGREIRLLDVYNERPVRVSAKVLVPVKEHPKVFSY